MKLLIALVLFSYSPPQKHTMLTRLHMNRRTAKLERIVSDSDTMYAFQFVNSKAWSFSRKKIISFSKDQLRRFSDDLVASQAALSQTTIDEKVYSISKTKLYGSWGEVVYKINYDDGFCKLNKRQLKRLIETIKKES